MIATALGVAAPDPGSAQAEQWQMWIDDALMLIGSRADSITPAPTVDQPRLNYVIREAVAAQVRRPDSATQVTTSVDDGSVSKTYRSGTGRIGILDEWWALLGLSSAGGGAYSIDTSPTGGTHLPWCSLSMGALYCSCGVDIAGFPIYEGGEFW
jgi:hypothetical protein